MSVTPIDGTITAKEFLTMTWLGTYELGVGETWHPLDFASQVQQSSAAVGATLAALSIKVLAVEDR